MKKRLLSVLLMCCMVLTLLPTTAFAEGSAEEPPVCSCETACMADFSAPTVTPERPDTQISTLSAAMMPSAAPVSKSNRPGVSIMLIL